MIVNEETGTTTQSLEVDVVQLDGGTQMREVVDRALITTYTEDIKSGSEFPPVDIFHDGKTYWLADGFHRFYATRDSGAKTISANVHQGSKRDAVLFSVGANSAHGLRRTNADKRKAVSALLDDKEWSGWSDRVIAEKCGVGKTTVSRRRDELAQKASCRLPLVTKGKDGKKRRRRKRPTVAGPDSFPDAEPDDKGIVIDTPASAPDVPHDVPAAKLDVEPPPSTKRHGASAAVAAREIKQTVAAFLRLKPEVKDVEPVLIALDEMQTLVEQYGQGEGPS